MYRRIPLLLAAPFFVIAGILGNGVGWIQVALGFGALIFVHELGHFLVAKATGVRVEEFSIGFGPFLFTLRRGHTIYALRMIPLGGFVKMRGQHDLQTVMDNAPDSYLSKSVPQRMAIIVAGVVMNVIFAYLILLVAFWGPGIGFNIAQVGLIGKAGPAATAKLEGVVEGTKLPTDGDGLRQGDLILAVNGTNVTRFHEVLQRVAYNGDDRPIELVVRRQDIVDGKPANVRKLRFVAQPKVLPDIGMASLAMEADKEPRHFSIGMEKAKWSEVNKGALISKVGWFTSASGAGLEQWDVIRSVGGNPVADGKALRKAINQSGGKSVELGVQRGAAEITMTLAPELEKYLIGVGYDDTGRINVLPDTAAAEAGLKSDDVIISIDGKPYSEIEFPKHIQAKKGTAMAVVIERDGKRLPDPIQVTARAEYSIGAAASDVNVVTRVVDGPAKDAGLREGDLLTALTASPSWETERVTLEVTWYRPGMDSHGPVTLVSTPAKGTPVIELREDVKRLFKFPLGGSMSMAFGEMGRLISDTFYTLHGLITRRVPAGALSGPVGIFDYTYKSTKFGVGFYLWFLAMISANLAVINMLPVPVLDGGHMMFLALEGIQRKPVSQRILEYAQYAGLLLLLALILFVTKNDISRFLP